MIAPTRERTERLLEKSGRITPREVLEAYEETGLQPTQGFLRRSDGSSCAVGALMARDGFDFGNEELHERIEVRDTYGGRRYVCAFEMGFDGSSDEGGQGYRDGARARRFVEARYGRLS